MALLAANNIQPEVCLYLQNPPDVETLKQITSALGCSIRDIIRTGENRYRELGQMVATLDEEQLVKMVADNPILLERPIVLHNGKAAVGRPPENIIAIL